MIEFYLGGARSGKSRLAEQRANQLAEMHDKELLYLATATAGDGEMADRIDQHQKDRGTHWHTIEEPLYLSEKLAEVAREDTCILVDCLTLWGTNLLLSDKENLLAEEKQKLLSTLPALPGDILFVSNEVGQGVVPADPLSRRFVDEMGFLHQQLAQLCDKVHFVVAGIAQTLK